MNVFLALHHSHSCTSFLYSCLFLKLFLTQFMHLHFVPSLRPFFCFSFSTRLLPAPLYRKGQRSSCVASKSSFTQLIHLCFISSLCPLPCLSTFLPLTPIWQDSSCLSLVFPYTVHSFLFSSSSVVCTIHHSLPHSSQHHKTKRYAVRNTCMHPEIQWIFKAYFRDPIKKRGHSLYVHTGGCW